MVGDSLAVWVKNRLLVAYTENPKLRSWRSALDINRSLGSAILRRGNSFHRQFLEHPSAQCRDDIAPEAAMATLHPTLVNAQDAHGNTFHLEKTCNGKPMMAASLLFVKLTVPVHVNHDLILRQSCAEFDLGFVSLNFDRPVKTVESIKVGVDIGHAGAVFRSVSTLQPLSHLRILRGLGVAAALDKKLVYGKSEDIRAQVVVDGLPAAGIPIAVKDGQASLSVFARRPASPLNRLRFNQKNLLDQIADVARQNGDLLGGARAKLRQQSIGPQSN